MSFHIEVDGASRGRPKYFICNKATLHPIILAKLSISSTSPIRIICDFDKLIFNPDTASKHKKRLHRLRICTPFATQKIKVSFANNKCDTTIPALFFEPIEKPTTRPLSSVAAIILLRASITITKSKGDNGSP